MFGDIEREIEANFKNVEREIEQGFANAGMNLGGFGGGLGNFGGQNHRGRQRHHDNHRRHHSHSPSRSRSHSHSHSHSHNHARQAFLRQEQAQELAFNLEREQAEQQRRALLREEENRLAMQRQALRQEQEALRQLEWQKEQAALAEKRKVERELRLKEEAAQAEKRRIAHEQYLKEQAILAEQRRIEEERQAEEEKRLAEERRIAEEKRLAELKIQEEKNEEKRCADFDAHQALISTANSLSFLELDQRINALSVLSNPIPRFADSQKNGIPNEKGMTLFFNLLINPNLLSNQKFELLQKLIAQKGYAPYLNLVFSSPVFELLLGDRNPMVLLDPLYMEAVFLYQMDLVPQLEAQIWPLLLQNPSFGSRLFSSFLNTGRHGAKALQFLEIWRFYTNLPDLHSLQQFYSGILRAYKAQLTPELELGIQANFLALTEQNWTAFYTVLQNSDFTHQRMMQFFDQWLQAPHLPATRDLPVGAYYNFISTQEIKTQLPDENKVWRAIIHHDGNTGFNLFNFLMTQGSQANKLFRFIECWLNQLTRDVDVIQAYKYLKLHIPETVLQDCKSEIRKMAELRIQELRYENKGIENVKDTTKWLKKSHPGFFSCSSAATATTSYSVFKLMEKNKPDAKKALQEEKEETAESINTKLANKGEEKQFKFKP